MTVKVYDKKINAERTMPEKAYLLLKNRMSFVSYVDEAGNEVEGTPQGVVVQKKSVEKVAQPVAVKTPEEIAAKKAELEAMNQAAIAKAQEKFENLQEAELVENVIEKIHNQIQPEVKVRKKPGPKPKNNA